MNRQIIVNKLLKEGFSQKTLMNFSDKELKSLSSRILGESEVMISKADPMLKQKVAAAQKEKKTIETYESKDLKGGQKKLDKNHNGKLDSQDFKILRGKKSEVKEENKPVDAHESKDLKGGQKKLDKNNNGKLDSQDFKMLRSKKSEVKEGTGSHDDRELRSIIKWAVKKLGFTTTEDDGKNTITLKPPMDDVELYKAHRGPGAENPVLDYIGCIFGNYSTRFAKTEYKSNRPLQINDERFKCRYHKRNSQMNKVSVSGFDSNSPNTDTKTSNINNKKNRREEVEVSEWVNNLAEQKYHSFTSKKEIMEMIGSKMGEVGSKVKKGHNDVPEFMTYDSIKNSEVEVAPAKPKVEPGQKPKRLSPFKDKPLVKPKPKASLGEAEVAPAKPKVEPGQKPKRLSPFKDKPSVKPKPKASLGEAEVAPAKPKVEPGQKPKRLSPFKDKPSVKPKPKASLGEIKNIKKK